MKAQILKLSAAWIRLLSQIDAKDGLLVIGLAMLGFGLFFVYWPLTFIVPGTLITGLALYGSLR